MSVGPSPFVIDDNTGEQVPVVQVEAVAAISMASTMGQSDMPPDAGKRIEQAMAAAAQNAIAAGVSKPEKIREAMLKARESAKATMKTEWRDFLSQQAAAQQEK